MPLASFFSEASFPPNSAPGSGPLEPSLSSGDLEFTEGAWNTASRPELLLASKQLFLEQFVLEDGGARSQFPMPG